MLVVHRIPLGVVERHIDLEAAERHIDLVGEEHHTALEGEVLHIGRVEEEPRIVPGEVLHIVLEVDIALAEAEPHTGPVEDIVLEEEELHTALEEAGHHIGLEGEEPRIDLEEERHIGLGEVAGPSLAEEEEDTVDSAWVVAGSSPGEGVLGGISRC